MLENQVAIQLRRLFGEDVYYYQRVTEVDFYVPVIELALQVCYSLKDPETRKREVDALIKMSKHINVKQMMIITKEEEETISENGFNLKVVPVWKFLFHDKAFFHMPGQDG